MGDAAKQAKASYCTELQNVNAEVTGTKSVYTYPERSDGNPAAVRASTKAETDIKPKNDITIASEVSRGHSKPETSRTPRGRLAEVSQKDKGLNVRIAKKLKEIMVKVTTVRTR